MVQSPAEYMSHLGIKWIMIQFSDWTWCFWLEASWSHQWWQWWGSFHAIRGSPRRTWSNRSLASVMREALSTESFSYSWKWLENQLIKTGKDMRETRPRRRESLLEECPQKTEGKPSRNLGVKVEDIPVPDWLTRGCVCVDVFGWSVRAGKIDEALSPAVWTYPWLTVFTSPCGPRSIFII